MTFPQSLKTLQNELIDTRRRYEDALKVAADRQVATLLLEMVELRMRADRQIREILGAAGEDDQQRNSFMSFLHRAVASVRAPVFRVRVESLPAFVNDEAQILLAYNNAIDDCGPYRRITDLLEQQRAALVAAIVKMDHVIFEERAPSRQPASEPQLLRDLRTKAPVSAL